MPQCGSLATLGLRNNRIADEGARKLAVAMPHCGSLATIRLGSNGIGDEGAGKLALAIPHCGSLATLGLSNNRLSPRMRADIELRLMPGLRDHLQQPAVPPAHGSVCVVGFGGVGKSRLIDTWRRIAQSHWPSFNREEDAPEAPENSRSKTPGIGLQAIPLKSSDRTKVNTMTWDFAGQPEFYVSHDVLLRWCSEATFVVLFRLQNDAAHGWSFQAEEDRMLHWLRFIASACAQQQQGRAPTVLLAGSFRPESWGAADQNRANAVLGRAKAVFANALTLPQTGPVPCIDCRKSADARLVALTAMVADAVEASRILLDRRVPKLCEDALRSLQTSRKPLLRAIKACDAQREKKQPAEIQYGSSPIRPVMTMQTFCEHVFCELTVKFDKKRAKLAGLAGSTALMEIMLRYLHGVGEVLWFGDVDQLRDVVVVTPGLFYSKVIGAVFQPASSIPNQYGVSLAGQHGTVALAQLSEIFEVELGIEHTQVEKCAHILCCLGLCYQNTQNPREPQFVFPGATEEVPPRSFPREGPTGTSGVFWIGRTIELTEQAAATTVMSPAMFSRAQVMALKLHRGTEVWKDGFAIPYATDTSAAAPGAEAGVQMIRQNDHVYRQRVVLLITSNAGEAARRDCTDLMQRLVDFMCKHCGVPSGRLEIRAIPPAWAAALPNPLKSPRLLNHSYTVSELTQSLDLDPEGQLTINGEQHKVS